jgi:hypothetical protein
LKTRKGFASFKLSAHAGKETTNKSEQAMKNELLIGQILPTEQFRDAIHVAIAPVIAGEKLGAGDHVGLLPDGKVGQLLAHTIGIVDPFLRKVVHPGERFWLFLYPNTVTSLRHEWIHPAFDAQTSPLVSDSKKWLRDYANDINTTYKKLMDGAKNFIECGEYLCEGGNFEGVSTNENFWHHYEIVTGETVPENQKQSFFSCSC